MIGERWMRWTILESGTKTSSKILQKLLGAVSSKLGHTFFAAMVVGLVQVISGFLVTRWRGQKLLVDRDNILGACLFGFVALLSTLLVFATFLVGGEMSTNTFIITLSIVPGAVIDLIFFKHKLNFRQWLGVMMAIVAGYFVLGSVSFAGVTTWPLWIWLSFGAMMTAAINQGITQKLKKIDPFVKNFWGGLVNVVISATAIMVLGSVNLFTDFSAPMCKLWIFAMMTGAIVVLMWCFNLLSYKGGASIALKKLVMNGAYLVSTLIVGALFFHESFTIGKVVGIVCYFAAFALMDTSTWRFVQNLFSAHKISTIQG